MARKINGIPPRRKDERDYEKEMNALYLLPYLQGLAEALSELNPNASTSAWLAVMQNYKDQFLKVQDGRFPRAAVERWARKVDKYHTDEFVRSFFQTAQVDIRPAIRGVGERTVEEIIERNISLIKTIPDTLHDKLTEAYIKAEFKAPLDLAEKEKIFNRIGGSIGYNLRRITRDQTNKLTGEMSRLRQTAAGITQYFWQTSEDDRVRETHEEKNGILFDWGLPPQDTGHPGEDIQCRCVAIPNITVSEIKRRFGE